MQSRRLSLFAATNHPYCIGRKRVRSGFALHANDGAQGFSGMCVAGCVMAFVCDAPTTGVWCLLRLCPTGKLYSVCQPPPVLRNHPFASYPFTGFLTVHCLSTESFSLLISVCYNTRRLSSSFFTQKPNHTSKMLVSIISVLAAATAVAAQSSPAPVVAGNPMGAKYVGTLPPKEGSALTGSIEGTTGADGKGVKFSVSFAGLPETGGPFMYHLHAKPVPADGNCTGTGAHLDPYMRGEVPICDASKPETCQTGDLSGKFGNMTERTFSAEYTDLYSATLPSDPAFFGALSFVVHLSNKTRIGCANFTMVSAGEGYPAASSSAGEGYPAASSAMPMPSVTSKSSGYAMMPPTTATSGMAQPSGMPGMPMNNVTSTIAMSPSAGLPMAPSSASASSPAEFSGAAVKVAGGAGAMLAAAAAALVL